MWDLGNFILNDTKTESQASEHIFGGKISGLRAFHFRFAIGVQEQVYD